jgi:hypothetical protein
MHSHSRLTSYGDGAEHVLQSLKDIKSRFLLVSVLLLQAFHSKSNTNQLHIQTVLKLQGQDQPKCNFKSAPSPSLPS